ncbi:MAG: NADH-dependent [FeFe] hydrogenase, group A6 [Defluviitaleaceae bacterium]|nr:NADH-dependent [FeFe] hydrogenase, group A6 [Defluviitaleaceae bacterium]MCL2263051.1 NADH-dependent [FeFe] hydrogenase, group A6 [Defluviitaleaceae bacterium]
MAKVTIDNIVVEVEAGSTILDAARKGGIDIPTLCYLKEANEIGACRVCQVEVQGARSLAAACVMPVFDGMVVSTTSKKVRAARRATVELILSSHNRDCLTCSANGNCELQVIANEMGIREVPFEGANDFGIVDTSSPSIVRDQSKCVLCGRCVNVCKKQQGASILDFTDRGISTKVSPHLNKGMNEVPCIYCGQCVNVCPTAALREKEDIDKVWAALENPDLHVVVQAAPAVRAALGEEFGMAVGTRVTGKMVTALKRLGFAKVFDTNFAADLTIMEEANELIDRMKNGGKLPMMTSCSPGWVRFCEFNYPEFLPNLSSCKSPMSMFGAILKSYYAEKANIDAKKIFSVAVMPCTSKKSEAERAELATNGLKDVDAVLTTRELAKMLKQAGVKFTALPDSTFDQDLLGEYSGGGVIFGATGGVMEAALRTAADVISNSDVAEVEYKAVRGLEGIKEAEVDFAGTKIKAAVVHGTANAAKLLDKIKTGEAKYDFIEVMACSGGCVNGGGQPRISAETRATTDVREARAAALYEEDSALKVRKSHKNTQIKKLYDDYLQKPNSHKAHDLLHTKYEAKESYPL